MAELVYQRPKLYKLQSEAFFNDFRYVLVEASTKAGKTVGCMAWLVEQAVFIGKEGREFWWVAPVSSVASIAFKRLKRGIPAFFIRSIISSPGKESITLINGAVTASNSPERACESNVPSPPRKQPRLDGAIIRIHSLRGPRVQLEMTGFTPESWPE